MHVALKVAYDGRLFKGSQIQPAQRTVEGDLQAAIKAVLGEEGMQRAGLKAASRTDAGVSALGSVFCISTDMPPESLVRALNANLKGVWIRSYAEVGEDFYKEGSLMTTGTVAVLNMPDEWQQLDRQCAQLMDIIRGGSL